ncbi:ferric reductase like transmembrane component-domain-containing protein [Dendryphion nanum]|uniref:Ferric reductase like transmembrane component-domain-containing protein n=1 Tax=Dendryphion nanum TaxID=256645 RepID=A0A9P9EGK9_9PLEO|nr:ferric reductase like transmembrane component-domain-containing protein [Dendryphion nanum]
MKLSVALAVSSLVSSSFAHLESFYFPGYGFSWYDPACGFACNNAISGATLVCTSHASGHSHMGGPTSPDCYASDTSYLTTLAYCIKSNCDPVKVPTWKREQFWSTKVTGDPTVSPKWDYIRALEEVDGVPTVEYNSSSKAVLNQTVLVPKATYAMQYNFNIKFDYIEMLQAKYCFVIVIIGFGIPIIFSLLARLPYMTGILDRVKPYLVYPSLIGTYHARPLPWLLGNPPTVGQALYIALFFILNLVLSCVNYTSQQPHPWGFPPREELLSYIGYRTGHIGYALLPLLILFSGRNNFLLWITNWSFSTFIILHRWVSRIFAIHAIVHSITLLLTYQGTGSYASYSKEPYWLWGIVATVLTCAMLVLSHINFRRLAYEAFLILHIIFAVLVIVGCWYHVILKWGFNFYDNWLFAACAVWFFDRLIRVLRVAKNGLRRAVITEIGSDHVRVDIQGMRWVSKPGHVGYVYFPTLNPLRPWENHPFSINSTAIFHSFRHSITPESVSLRQSSPGEGCDVEKSPGNVQESRMVHEVRVVSGTTGVTLFIKKNTGMTSLLKSCGRLPILIDGPYPQSSSSDVLECDRVLLLGGGIGITGLLSWLQAHPNVKLAWSVKSTGEALVREMDAVLAAITDKEVVIGRLNVESLLRAEAEAGYRKVGVVICGPAEMCDDVRAMVAGLGRSGKTIFELEVDAFSW